MVTSLEVESSLLVGSEVCVGSCCRATAKEDEHTFSIKWDPVSPKSSVKKQLHGGKVLLQDHRYMKVYFG